MLQQFGCQKGGSLKNHTSCSNARERFDTKAQKRSRKNVALKHVYKHNRLNVGRIALERLVGALINCSLLQSGEGGRGSLNGTKKFNSGLQITTRG